MIENIINRIFKAFLFTTILLNLFLLSKISFSIQINPISVDNSQADIKKCQNKMVFFYLLM